jgi:hypothetical protein
MAVRRKLLQGILLLALPLGAANRQALIDAPYVVLTGYSRHELEQLSYLPEPELEKRIGLSHVPGGLTGERGARGRSAHAIASYLGTRRWGPDVTIGMGYLREYIPALFLHREADPADIAANYAGVAYALEELHGGH